MWKVRIPRFWHPYGDATALLQDMLQMCADNLAYKLRMKTAIDEYIESGRYEDMLD